MTTSATTSPPERTGTCLCGAIKYRQVGSSVYDTVCHCIPCRKWTGSVAFAAAICPKEVSTDKEDAVAHKVEKKRRKEGNPTTTQHHSKPNHHHHRTTIKMTRSSENMQNPIIHPSQLSHRSSKAQLQTLHFISQPPHRTLRRSSSD
jgi:hypothetical protein